MGFIKRGVVIIMLSLAGLSAYWLSFDLEKALVIGELLPSDTLLFMQWNKFSTFFNEIAQSKIVQHMQNKEFPTTLQTLGMDKTWLLSLQKSKDFFSEFGELPLVHELWQHEGMLAFIPGAEQEGKPEEPFFSNLVFFLPTDGESYKKIVQPLVDAQSAQPNWSFHQLTVRELRLSSGRTLHLCHLNNFVFFAFSRAPIERCLAQYMQRKIGGSKAGLDQNAWFQDHVFVPQKESEFFVYVNSAKLKSVAPLYSYTENFTDAPRPQEIALTHMFIPAERKIKLSFKFKPDELVTWTKKYKLSPPEIPQIMASNSGSTLFHLWSNWCHTEFMEQMSDKLYQTEIGSLVLTALSGFLSQKELSWWELKQPFNEKAGLVVLGERNESNQLRPRFSLYFGMKDTTRMDSLLSQLFSDFSTQKVQLSHGVEVVSFSMAGGLIKPAYVISNNLLIFADNLSLAKQIIAEMRPPANTEKMGAANEPGDEKNNFFLYIKNREAAEGLNELLSFFVQVKNEKGEPMASDQEKLMIRQIVLPVVETLGKAENSQFAIRAEQNEAVFEGLIH